MIFIKEKGKGILLCFFIGCIALFLGKKFPIIGGPVFAILIGMIVTLCIKEKQQFQAGITFTSKKVLQYAVILLGFGLNLSVIAKTGKQSLPIILSTITTSLVIAYVLKKRMKISSNIATLVGVGSSICGGSAIAASAPVIEADDEEVATAISVIFLFNVLAAIIFPWLGTLLHFQGSEGFGVFAGTAVNDTSSVTATASTWDSMYHLGSATLDKAVTVKLTRTLAIIPITLGLAYFKMRKAGEKSKTSTFSWKKVFPFFILYFLMASIITTISTNVFHISNEVFLPLKELSKFFIIMAMASIGLNTDIVKLIKNGGKPILLGFCCWVGITIVSLWMQYMLKIW
ncbi:YeiH family protein [Erysipelotrichaceae bacterium HCN-30851]